MNVADGFRIVDHDEGAGACLIALGPWHDGLDRVVEERQIRVIRLSQHIGWPGGDDLSFLAAHPNVIGVELYDKTVKTLDGLRRMSNLQHLSFEADLRGRVDFTAFPFLRRLEFDWVNGAETVGSCVGLVRLNIGSYRLPDLSILSKLDRLEALYFNSRSITSLRGIESLRSLRLLDMAYCPKLVDLDGLECCERLQNIHLTTCKAVRNLDVIGRVRRLLSLYISDCGRIDTLLPLHQCKELTYLYAVGTTTIVDGDLRFLLDMPNIKDVRMADKRHYKPRIDEIVWAVKQRSH